MTTPAANLLARAIRAEAATISRHGDHSVDDLLREHRRAARLGRALSVAVIFAAGLFFGAIIYGLWLQR